MRKTHINYTKYVATKNRDTKEFIIHDIDRDKLGRPKTWEMGTTIEAGVAEAVTHSPPSQFDDIDDPVALTTKQLYDYDMLGDRKKNKDKAVNAEAMIQLSGIDIIVMPRADFELFKRGKHPRAFGWGFLAERCKTIQVKYQPFAHAYRTVNFETFNRYVLRDPEGEVYDEPTKHGADYTAYVVTSQVIILTETSTYKELTRNIQDIPIGDKYQYSNWGELGKKYVSRHTYTRRLDINTLLRTGSPAILGLSPLFEQYHLKARQAGHACAGHEFNSVSHWYYSQSWAIDTYKEYLVKGTDALFTGDEYGQLREGVHLQGSGHTFG